MKLFSSHQSITPSDDVTSRPADTAAKYGEALAVLAPTPNHNLSVLAGFPQRGKSTFWALRDSRNDEKLLFWLCGIPATGKNYFLGFAGFPQRGKTTFWALRDSRNDEKLLFELCGIPASISKNEIH